MAFTLHGLTKTSGRVKRRRGRGNGSGRGTYSGRGMKGQNARTGGKNAGGHAGKKVPSYILRLPKKFGFQSRQDDPEVVNVTQLNIFNEGAHVTPAMMVRKGLISSSVHGVKILGTGALVKKLTVTAHAFSKGAEHAITKQGGVVTRLSVSAKKPKNLKEE